MRIVHAGPFSKLLAYRAAFLAKECRYADGQIVYEPGAWQIGYTKDRGCIALAKSEVISLVT
jgi:hypothetical protein